MFRARRIIQSRPGLTLTQAWRLWQAEGCHLKLSCRTVEGYAVAMRRAVGALPSRPHRPDVERWMRSMVGEGLSACTINWFIHSLRAVLSQAARVNPAARALSQAFAEVALLPELELQPRCPPTDTLRRILPACRNRGEVAFVRLAACAGLRVGEIRGLETSDFCRDTGVIVVCRTIRGPGRKNRKRHSVRLDPGTRDALIWTVDNRDELRPLQGPVLRRTDGKIFPWGVGYLEGLRDRIREKLGEDWERYMPRGTVWHGLRHLGASEVARATGNVWSVMRWLGDSSPRAAQKYVDLVRGATADAGIVASRLIDSSPAPDGPGLGTEPSIRAAGGGKGD